MTLFLSEHSLAKRRKKIHEKHADAEGGEEEEGLFDSLESSIEVEA